MSTAAKLGGGVVVLVLAAAIWMVVSGGRGERGAAIEPRAPEAVGAPLAREGASGAARVEPRVRSSERSPQEPSQAAAGAGLEPAGSQGVPAPALVRARFLAQEDDRPLEGVELSVSSWSGPLIARSGRDGEAELRVPAVGLDAWTQGFEVRAEGRESAYPSARLSGGEESALGEIRLRLGSSALGRVVDLAGWPIAGALVRAEPASLPDWGDEDAWRRCGLNEEGDRRLPLALAPQARSMADGTFLVAGIAPGRLRLWAVAEGMRFAWTEPLEARAGEAIEGVELVLEPLRDEDRIAGRVLDPTGAPAGGAGIVARGEGELAHQMLWSVADEEGRFELVLSRPGLYELRALDPKELWGDATAEGVALGVVELVLCLTRRRPIEVRVLDESGQPIEDFGLLTLSADGMLGFAGRVEHLRPGAAELVVPGHSFQIEVAAPGYRKERRGPFEPAQVPESIELRLRRLPVVAGRVLAEGEPVKGAEVELAQAHPQWNVATGGFRSRAILAGHGSARTDAQGRFRIPIERDGEYYLRAEADGRAPGEIGPFALGGEAEPAELSIELPRGGVIEGRVLLPDGRDGAGTIVGLNRGDGRPRTQRAGAGGWYRFEGLAPGSYEITRRKREHDPRLASTGLFATGAPIQASCTLMEGRSLRFDLIVEDGDG